MVAPITTAMRESKREQVRLWRFASCRQCPRERISRGADSDSWRVAVGLGGIHGVCPPNRIDSCMAARTRFGHAIPLAIDPASKPNPGCSTGAHGARA